MITPTEERASHSTWWCRTTGHVMPDDQFRKPPLKIGPNLWARFRAAYKECSRWLIALLTRIIGLILLPWRLLLNKIDRAEDRVSRQIIPGWSRSARFWLLRQFLRLANWLVYWAVAGPIWLIEIFIIVMLFVYFVIKPYEYTGNCPGEC
jgi:hypothetical protein